MTAAERETGCPVSTFRIYSPEEGYGYEVGCADYQQHVCLVKTRVLFRVRDTARGITERQEHRRG